MGIVPVKGMKRTKAFGLCIAMLGLGLQLASASWPSSEFKIGDLKNPEVDVKITDVVKRRTFEIQGKRCYHVSVLYDKERKKCICRLHTSYYEIDDHLAGDTDDKISQDWRIPEGDYQRAASYEYPSLTRLIAELDEQKIPFIRKALTRERSKAADGAPAKPLIIWNMIEIELPPDSSAQVGEIVRAYLKNLDPKDEISIY